VEGVGGVRTYVGDEVDDEDVSGGEGVDRAGTVEGGT